VDHKTDVLLKYAKRLTENPRGVSDEDLQALTDAGWSREDIYEATALIGFFNFSGRMEVASGLPMDSFPHSSAIPEAKRG
jgi:alkylhydroperoxidase family enzyme